MSFPEPIVFPATKTHTHTVVFLHGRGDTAPNFAASLQCSRSSQNLTLQDSFPTFRWVYPGARPELGVHSRGALVSQWFDVWDVTDFSKNEQLQAKGLRTSVPHIQQILAQEAALLGGRWDRIVLMGISQGAATSVHTMLNLNLQTLPDGVTIQGRMGLAAFIGFSCRMPFPGRSLTETRKILGLDGVPDNDDVLRNTPMLLEHCLNDPLVLIEHGKNLQATLQEFGAQLTWKEYPTGGHWFNSPYGIDDAILYLRTHVLDQYEREMSSIPRDPNAMDCS